MMPLLLGLAGVGAPRLALFAMWVSGYTNDAFMTYIWPFVGFLVIPYTTLAYTLLVKTAWEITPANALLLVLAFAVDFAVHNGFLLAVFGEIQAYYKRIS